MVTALSSVNNPHLMETPERGSEQLIPVSECWWVSYFHFHFQIVADYSLDYLCFALIFCAFTFKYLFCCA